ncbi:MAG TPA: hypothetical protein VHN80_16455, partial [Kineosporiaceae bacterium]|nr:hypothetical protein [Kineosporiaceae bacterium]
RPALAVPSRRPPGRGRSVVAVHTVLGEARRRAMGGKNKGGRETRKPKAAKKPKAAVSTGIVPPTTRRPPASPAK